MKKVLLFAFLLFLCLKMQAQHTNQYCNSVFPFCIDVPGNLVRQGDSKTGYGQFFKAKDGATLTVFGTYNTEQESIKARFDRESAAITSDTTFANSTQLPTIELADLQPNNYTIIYQNQSNSNLIYRKLENNNWLSLELQYPTSKAKDYTEKAKRMISSFR